jgi:hypothetical protein
VEGSSRLLAGLGAATLLHLALLPLLGFLLGGRGTHGGDQWRDGVVVELIRPAPAEPGIVAPPMRPAAPKTAAPLAPEPVVETATPAVAQAKAARPGTDVPRGRRVPRSSRGDGARRPAPADAQPAFVVAVADPGPSGAAAAQPLEDGEGASSEASPVAAPESSPSDESPAGAAAREAQAGCTDGPDGIVCGVEQTDVLNRPQTFMGMVIDPGYQERGYDFHREGDSLVYQADPHNAVIIREDGTIDSVSGPKPSDALCIMGGAPLPWDIPELPYYQYREIEDATAGLRQELADRQEASWMGDALRGLPAELSAAVSRGDKTPAEQRWFLFRRWDECEESSGGAEARRIIERFIRERYPQGGAQACTAAELDEMNGQRRSHQPFCPYGCP